MTSLIQSLISSIENKNILLKMRVQNDENKRKLQQKYQKYKANQLQTLTNQSVPVLVDRDQNLGEKIVTGQTTFDDDRFEKMLESLPKNDMVLQVMLTDPDIHKLSESLRRQAQQNTMKTLIGSFPDRYRSLLQSEAKLKIMQKCSKEKQSKHMKQTEILMEKLLSAELKIKQLGGINEEQSQKMKQYQTNNYDQYSEEVKRKETIIFQMRDQVEGLEKKCGKLKEDYNHAHSVILQLRQQEESTMKQTQRLIQKLKQTEEKLSKAHKRLLQHDNDKKIQLNFSNQVHQNQLNELKQKISHLEQLLEQSTIRIEYKQSLIVLSEKQYSQNLQKLEDQLLRKHEGLQSLRQEHLQALRSIDELEERINSQEENYVREYQVWSVQREELKKNLDKSYQTNGQIKAELDVKSQLIKILQKSVQCLKSTFESDISIKNNEWLEQNRQIIQLKSQMQIATNQLQISKKSQQRVITELSKLQKQKQMMQTEISSQKQRIKLNEAVFRKYMQKIEEQEHTCCQLQFQLQNWIASQQHLKQQDQDTKICRLKPKQQNGHNEWTPRVEQQKISKISPMKQTKQVESANRKLIQYEKVIDKLKQQVINLTANAKQHKSNGSRIVKQLIQQNKQLKSELQNHKKPSMFIKLITN